MVVWLVVTSAIETAASMVVLSGMSLAAHLVASWAELMVLMKAETRAQQRDRRTAAQ